LSFTKESKFEVVKTATSSAITSDAKNKTAKTNFISVRKQRKKIELKAQFKLSDIFFF